MTSIATTVVVVVAPVLVAYIVFLAVARGLSKDDDYEVEVRFFPPTIRRKVKRGDRRSRRADTVHQETMETTAEQESSTMNRASANQLDSPSPTEDASRRRKTINQRQHGRSGKDSVKK